MNKASFLAYADEIYKATRKLVEMADPQDLSYRPAANCMSIGQVIHHLTDASGAWFKVACENGWDKLPADAVGLPSLEQMPGCETVPQALAMLEADRKTLHDTVNKLSEQDFASKPVTAPWMGGHMEPADMFGLSMLSHQLNHKMQLFQYLKLRGKPVNTMHLYGM